MTTLDDLEKSIERRKAELGLAGDRYVMPNSSEARTPEKRELLRLLADMAADRKVRLPFDTNR